MHNWVESRFEEEPFCPGVGLLGKTRAACACLQNTVYMRERRDRYKGERQWWAPLWQGLVMDPGARHYQKMGQAVWLFLYFILNANRQTGLVMRKTSTIVAQTGFRPRTIRNWLKTLRRGEYITARTTGRFLLIEIQQWKTLAGRHDPAYQSGQIVPPRVAKSCQPGKDREDQNCANPSAKLKSSGAVK